MKNTKKNVIVHGECFLFPSSLPEGSEKVEVNQPYFIVADSETTGNHHVVDVGPSVTLFRNGEKLFMKNEAPTNLRCVQADRHDEIALESGTWEFGIQKEYDHITDEINNVRD